MEEVIFYQEVPVNLAQIPCQHVLYVTIQEFAKVVSRDISSMLLTNVNFALPLHLSLDAFYAILHQLVNIAQVDFSLMVLLAVFVPLHCQVAVNVQI